MNQYHFSLAAVLLATVVACFSIVTKSEMGVSFASGMLTGCFAILQADNQKNGGQF
jgi:hypothetical protein